MNLSGTLEKLIQLLEASGVRFAIAGGLVANIYRKEIRFTNDIDIAVISDETEEKLNDILKELNLNSGYAKEGDLQKSPFRRQRARTPVQIIVGRNKLNPDAIGVDFLLKSLPWVTEAVERAQSNKIKFLNHNFPCLTLEDMILSKLYAIKNELRYKDLDDLEQLIIKQRDIDKAYLTGRMLKYELTIPKEIRKRINIDPEIGRVAREIERLDKK